MAPRLLFNSYDIWDLVNRQRELLKEACQTTPDGEAENPDSLRLLKERFSLTIPTLSEERYATERQTKMDVRHEHDRWISDRSKPVLVDATEITMHIPFEGDASFFDARPTTVSSSPPRGDVVGGELLLVMTVSRPGIDVAAHLDRELLSVRQYLNWLEQGSKSLAQALEGELNAFVARVATNRARRAAITSKLGIPVRNVPTLRPADVSYTLPARPAVDWDFFVSHASEDKDSLARPLAAALRGRGYRVWYDEFSLRLGDSLRGSIDAGLANSRFGIVILSNNFFAKHWPVTELNGLAAREVNGSRIIIPVWYGVTQTEVAQFSPTLADRIAAVYGGNLDQLVERIHTRLEQT